jgi:hypothetical protein
MRPPPPGQRAPALQGGDLRFEQFALEQHLAELRFQPLALEFLSMRRAGAQARLAGGQEGGAPAAQRRQPQHRVALALPRHPSAPAGTGRTRRLRRHGHLSSDSVR